MIDRINALGQFLVNKTGKNFNFKQIKNDHMYPGILFSFSGEDYLVTPDKAELDLTIALMSSRTFEDYPPKHARKYTHRKFEKINKKKSGSRIGPKKRGGGVSVSGGGIRGKRQNSLGASPHIKELNGNTG